MSVVIRDEEDIKAYFEGFMVKYPDLNAVKYVDVDDDVEDMTENYFKNHYKGTVLFLGIYEHGFKLNNSLSYNYPHCQVSVLTRYDRQRPDTLIAARKKTRLLITKILHTIKEDQAFDPEDFNGVSTTLDLTASGERYDPTAGHNWTFKLANDLMMPVGDIKNCGCRGWSIDCEFGFPVTEVI